MKYKWRLKRNKHHYTSSNLIFCQEFKATSSYNTIQYNSSLLKISKLTKAATAIIIISSFFVQDDITHLITKQLSNQIELYLSVCLSIYGIYIAPLQGNYSEALPGESLAKRKSYDPGINQDSYSVGKTIINLIIHSSISVLKVPLQCTNKFFCKRNNFRLNYTPGQCKDVPHKLNILYTGTMPMPL